MIRGTRVSPRLPRHWVARLRETDLVWCDSPPAALQARRLRPAPPGPPRALLSRVWGRQPPSPELGEGPGRQRPPPRGERRSLARLRVFAAKDVNPGWAESWGGAGRPSLSPGGCHVAWRPPPLSQEHQGPPRPCWAPCALWGGPEEGAEARRPASPCPRRYSFSWKDPVLTSSHFHCT